jgi:hypothetical protein
MNEGVPIGTRLIIEFMIANYRRNIEPTIGVYVNLLIKSIDEENVPALKLLGEILDVLHTPTTQFLPVVQMCLPPDQAGTNPEVAEPYPSQ